MIFYYNSWQTKILMYQKMNKACLMKAFSNYHRALKCFFQNIFFGTEDKNSLYLSNQRLCQQFYVYNNGHIVQIELNKHFWYHILRKNEKMPNF